MMLAFLVDQTSSCAVRCSGGVGKLGSKRLLWERMRALFYTYQLDSMRACLKLCFTVLRGPPRLEPRFFLNSTGLLTGLVGNRAIVLPSCEINECLCDLKDVQYAHGRSGYASNHAETTTATLHACASGWDGRFTATRGRRGNLGHRRGRRGGRSRWRLGRIDVLYIRYVLLQALRQRGTGHNIAALGNLRCLAVLGDIHVYLVLFGSHGCECRAQFASENEVPELKVRPR